MDTLTNPMKTSVKKPSSSSSRASGLKILTKSSARCSFRHLYLRYQDCMGIVTRNFKRKREESNPGDRSEEVVNHDVVNDSSQRCMRQPFKHIPYRQLNLRRAVWPPMRHRAVDVITIGLIDIICTDSMRAHFTYKSAVIASETTTSR
jgi:hypothetical protein